MWLKMAFLQIFWLYCAFAAFKQKWWMVFGRPASWALFCCNSRKRRTDWEDEWRLSAIAYGLVHIRIRTYAFIRTKVKLYCIVCFFRLGCFSLTGVSNTLVSVSSSKKVFFSNRLKMQNFCSGICSTALWSFFYACQAEQSRLKDITIGRKHL